MCETSRPKIVCTLVLLDIVQYDSCGLKGGPFVQYALHIVYRAITCNISLLDSRSWCLQ
jgi:hypothetical protein